MARTKQSARKVVSKGESSQSVARRSIRAREEVNSDEKFENRNFWAERGFDLKGASNTFTTVVGALCWQKLIKQSSCFYKSIVQEFFEGIPEDAEGKAQMYSMVRGIPVSFDLKEINEFYNLGYSGLAFAKKVETFGKKEMDVVKGRIAEPRTVWEKGSAREFKINRGALIQDAQVWFNFVKHSLLPTSHTTNMEKERLLLIDDILCAAEIDVERLISREILLCKEKKVGFLFFPCLVTDLCIKAGVEMSNEPKEFPKDAFPTKLKEKTGIAATFGSDAMLQQFMHKQQTIWNFQREHFEWEKETFAKLLKGKDIVQPPEFPLCVFINERDAVEGEISEEEDVEEEVIQKKKKAVKKGKKKIIEEEEEDGLLSVDDESLSEGEKEENVSILKELNQKSDEEDPSSEEVEQENEEEETTDIEMEPNPNLQSPQPQPSPKQPTPPSPHATQTAPSPIPSPTPQPIQDPNPTAQPQPEINPPVDPPQPSQETGSCYSN